MAAKYRSAPTGSWTFRRAGIMELTISHSEIFKPPDQSDSRSCVRFKRHRAFRKVTNSCAFFFLYVHTIRTLLHNKISTSLFLSYTPHRESAVWNGGLSPCILNLGDSRQIGQLNATAALPHGQICWYWLDWSLDGRYVGCDVCAG
jgi:hypothetical protein